MLPEQFRAISFNGGSVAFPTDWKGSKGRDGQQFLVQAPNGQIQAILSVYYFSPVVSEQDDKEVFDRFLKLRLQTEQTAGKNITISTPMFLIEQNGTMIATYEGREATVRHFAAKLAMRGGTLVMIYLEAVGQDQETISKITPKIFESIIVHQK